MDISDSCAPSQRLRCNVYSYSPRPSARNLYPAFFLSLFPFRSFSLAGFPTRLFIPFIFNLLPRKLW